MSVIIVLVTSLNLLGLGKTNFSFLFLFIRFLCIYTSNVIPFPGVPSRTLLSYPPSHCFYEGAPPPTHHPHLTALAYPYTGKSSLHRTTPPSHARQYHPLLHMRLEPWVSPCVLLGWWFSPWELWDVWLVDMVVPPVGLQIPSAPAVLSLTPPFGTPY